MGSTHLKKEPWDCGARRPQYPLASVASERVRTGSLIKSFKSPRLHSKSPYAYERASLAHHKSLLRQCRSLAEPNPTIAGCVVQTTRKYLTHTCRLSPGILPLIRQKPDVGFKIFLSILMVESTSQHHLPR